MYWVYIIESIRVKRFYVGSTSDINKRIIRHNQGGSVWTRRYKPWRLIYTEKYKTKEIALKREKEIKSWKSGIKFKNLIKQSLR